MLPAALIAKVWRTGSWDSNLLAVAQSSDGSMSSHMYCNLYFLNSSILSYLELHLFQYQSQSLGPDHVLVMATFTSYSTHVDNAKPVTKSK